MAFIIRWLLGMPRKYDDRLNGMKPARTILEPERLVALKSELPFEGSALGLAIDLKGAEIARLPMVCAALVLLRAAAPPRRATG